MQARGLVRPSLESASEFLHIRRANQLPEDADGECCLEVRRECGVGNLLAACHHSRVVTFEKWRWFVWAGTRCIGKSGECKC